VRQIQRISGQKGGTTGYDGYKKVKENKLSVLVDRNGLPLACTVPPANAHDSRPYEPTLEALRFRMCGIAQRSSLQMQPTIPGKFASTVGNKEPRAISR